MFRFSPNKSTSHLIPDKSGSECSRGVPHGTSPCEICIAFHGTGRGCCQGSRENVPKVIVKSVPLQCLYCYRHNHEHQLPLNKGSLIFNREKCGMVYR